MMPAIAIVGGGISGLYAAHLLNKHSIPFLLLEARERLGGRVLSVSSEGVSDDPTVRFDLGPSWYWPNLQPRMRRLINELGLKEFPQYENGDLLVERFRLEQIHRVQGFASGNTSFRIAGGMAAVIDGLASSLPTQVLRLGTQVIHAERHLDTLRLHALDPQGTIMAIEVPFALLHYLLGS